MIELINLENDFYEQDNIIQKDDKEIVLLMDKFSKILEQIPEEDNQPLYHLI